VFIDKKKTKLGGEKDLGL